MSGLIEENWIYLSEDIIKSQMTNDKSEAALRHFYKRVLLRGDYKENVEYKKIEESDELVQKLEKEELKETRGGHNKVYYAVTESIYQKLRIRGNFIKNKKERKNTEIKVSDELSKKLGGVREVFVKKTGMRIDILTDEEIIEVKSFHRRVMAIGQIIYYGKFYPSRQKKIHLFDHFGKKDKYFQNICNELEITVSYQ
jgi:hypothetical protein